MLHDEQPYLLARVRWPDVFQAMSPARPEWQDDIGLFDLPHDPTSVTVTLKHAAAIAAGWGAQPVPSPTPKPALVRRMPADWSNLSRAEKEAWAIEFTKTRRRSARRWRRRDVAHQERVDRFVGIEADVIDLTALNGAAPATVEGA
jgi:hypothetical protein